MQLASGLAIYWGFHVARSGSSCAKKGKLALPIHSKAKESIDACEDPDPEFRRIMTSIAASGAVAAVALVDGADLYVASTGDCSVVLGSISENDTWIAKKLTTEHSTENPKEMKRIQDEHPTEKMRYRTFFFQDND